MKKTIMLILIFTSIHAFAQVDMQGVPEKNMLETWYINFGLGYAGHGYPEEVEEFIDFIEDVPGSDRFTLGMDLLGIYWPLNEQTLIGGAINGSADTFEASDLPGDLKFDIYNIAYSASGMYFLNNRIGSGPFVRGDLGLVRLSAEAEVEIFGDKEELEADSDWGGGLLVGLGYGFPVASGTRLLLNANYSIRQVEGDQYTTLGITLNGLF